MKGPSQILCIIVDMNESAEKYKNPLLIAVSWIIIITSILFFLIYFSSLLQPFVVALIIWFLIFELKRLIGKIKIRGKILHNGIRTLMSICIIFMAFYFIGNLIVSNLEQIIDRLPQYELKQDRIVKEIEGYIKRKELTSRVNNWLNSIELRPILSGLVNSISAALSNIFIILIYIVFLLLEESSFSKKLKILTKSRKGIDKLFAKVNKAISDYISLKTVISLLTGVLSYIVLFILGVDFPVLWAFLIFIFNFIPYVGSLIATVIPALFAVVQFGSLFEFLWVLIGVEAVQILVGNYVEPKVLGRSLNLSPLVVLITLAFWGSIWGILGMVLSVPIMSIITLILAQFPETRSIAIMLSENGNIDSYVIKEGPVNGEKEITEKINVGLPVEQGKA